HEGDARDQGGIELLEAVERARHGGVAQGGEGADRDHLPARAGDIDVAQLVGVQPVDPLDLGDDLVAAAADVEEVDVVAAHGGGEIGADLGQVQAQGRDLVAVDHDLGLGLVDLDVDLGREEEHARLGRVVRDLLRQGQQLVEVGGGGDDELHREVVAAGQRRREPGVHLDAGNGGQPA